MSSGSGKIFGGRTPFDKGEMVSDRGVKTLIPGRAPASPEDSDPDSDQTPDQVHPPTPPPTEGQADQPSTALGNAPAERRQDGTLAPGGGQAATAAEAQAQFLANAAVASRQPVPDAAADAARLERAAFERPPSRSATPFAPIPALSA